MYFILTAIKSQKNSQGKRSQFMIDCGEHATTVITTVACFLVVLATVLLVV